MVVACAKGPGHILAQQTVLALLLAHGTLLMDSREVMLMNAWPSLLCLEREIGSNLFLNDFGG
jgi:hypothetical protein